MNLCAILLARTHIMKGPALRFLRYPLTVLVNMMRRKYASEFVTQDSRLSRTPIFLIRAGLPRLGVVIDVWQTVNGSKRDEVLNRA